MRERLKRLDAERREKLFDAATEEFAEHGYEGASLNRILGRAEMGKSSLYYYFEDKADLFAATTERLLGRIMEQVGGFSLEELTAETYWEELAEFGRRGTAFFSAHGWTVKFARLFYRLRAQSAGGTARVFTVVRWWTEQTVVRGQELGVVRTDLPLSFLVDAALALGEAMDRWMLEHWEELTPELRLEENSKQFAVMRRVLEAPADSDAS